MSVVSLLLLLALVGSSTVVFNLTETTQGLFIPFQSENGLVNVKVVSQYYLGSMLMDQIAQYPSISTGSSTSDIPADSPPREAFIPPLSIAHNSPFGNFYRNAMLTFSGEEDLGFRLIANISDLSEFCLDGIVSTAQFSYPTLFHLSVSLLPNAHRPRSLISETEASRVDFATINTLRRKDRIPTAVYRALIEELQSLHDSWPFEPPAFQDVIHLMPSIQYTIYRTAESSEAVANIVLAPEDYVRQNSDESFELQVEPAEFAPMLGVNFLRNVAIYLNYQENEIGFCDPK